MTEDWDDSLRSVVDIALDPRKDCVLNAENRTRVDVMVKPIKRSRQLHRGGQK